MSAKIQLVIVAIKFLVQLLRWMEQSSQREPEQKSAKFVLFKDALKEAEEGKVEKLEEMFAILKPGD